jgi:restriction system protein
MRQFKIDAETLPDLPGMMLVTVKALKDLGGSATIQDLDEKVIELEGVTEAEQAFTMLRDENRTRVNYYLAWARTYLKRGSALDNSSRGVWALTETGAVISELTATRAIYDQVTLEERERALETFGREKERRHK